MVTQGIKANEALTEARAIAEYDPDLKASAMLWAQTGEMATSPEVDGETPMSLDKHYYPTQTFSILHGLRTRPEDTKRALKHSPSRNDYGPDRLEPDVKFGELLGRLYLLSKEARDLHTEAIALGIDTPIVGRLASHADSAQLAHDQLHDSLLTKNMVPNGAVTRRDR